MKAAHLGLSLDRHLMHLQTLVFKKGSFDIEISWHKMKFNILIKRNLKQPDPEVTDNLFLKQMWIPQAK